MIEIFVAYLITERGLATATVSSYVSVASLFFFGRCAVGDVDLATLSAAEVTGFVFGRDS